MTTTTIDEAREKLQQAEASYRDADAVYEQSTVDKPTPKQVLQQSESRAAFETAARVFVEAQQVYDSLDKQLLDEGRKKAEAELVRVEAELVTAIETAEHQILELGSTLDRVQELSRDRYALNHTATGRAHHRLLADNAIAGWIKHCFMRLDLRDLERPLRHHRAPLAEILGLSAGVGINEIEEDE